MTTTSDQFLIDGKSFVTETGDDSATVVRTSTGAALTQTEIEEAGEHYDSDLKQINYAKIFNLKFGSNFISKLGASSEWMAKAITDRKYKNAFKKATNKNSANVSSIEPETSSVFATATNNTDSNGASTLNRGGSVLRYPLNEDVKSYDYLKVCAYRYKPREFSQADDKTNRLTGDYQIGDLETQRKTGNHTVWLPMEPQGLAESNSVSWDQGELNPLDAALANISGATIKGAGKGGDEAIKNMVNATGQAFNDAKAAADDDTISAFFAAQAVGNQGIFQRATGQAVNNNLELLFKGPQLRSFNYNFRFTPRDEAESNEIRKIIKFFKKSIAPERGKAAIFLKSPHIFKLKYYYKNGQQHPFLNKIKTCACTNFSVQYAPDGSYMTYNDGSMTSYTVSLAFGELNPIYADDIIESSNDMSF